MRQIEKLAEKKVGGLPFESKIKNAHFKNEERMVRHAGLGQEIK